MNNYNTVLAAAQASVVGPPTSNNTTQQQQQRSGHISPTTNINTNSVTNLLTTSSNNSSNNNLASLNLNNSNNNTSGGGGISLPQNILTQLNVANLTGSSSSPNRPNPSINPFFRSTSAMPSNTQQQQQQLTNLIQQQQQQIQQKKLAGSSNLLNFNNTNPNMNSNLLSNTISRPNQLQPNSQTMDSFTPLDPSDFPVLHRTSNSPFQQQHLAQLQQQLRVNNAMNFQNGPNSAPILNQSSLQNFMMQLQQSATAQNSNLNPSPASQMMLNSLQGANNPLGYGLGLGGNLSQMSAFNVQKNVNTGSNMWSNFGSSKDRLGLKGQQTDVQHQEFNIQQEDFPALPRPQSVHNKSEGTGQNLTSTNSISSNDLSTLKSNEPANNLQLSSSQNNVNSSSSSMLTTNLSSGINNSNPLPSSNTINPNKQTTLNQGQFSSGSSTGSTQGNTNAPPTSTQNPNKTSSTANTNTANPNVTGSSSAAVKKGIIISPDGRISNVPPNMLLDQFGMVGLLAYLRAADREKDFFALALGTDLTALGLNLNSNENLYHSFLSPFSDVPCRLQDIDYPVPTEYIMNCQIKEKLAPIDVSRYNEDTLFYLFHMNGGDLMQLQAAAVLYDRDWRYHTEKRFWLTKVPGLEPQQKTVTYEKGVYTVFDVNQWRRMQLEMTIEYNKLAEKPQLPSNMLQNSSSTSSNNNNNLPSVLNLQQLQHQQQQLHQTFGSGGGMGSGVVSSGVPLTTNSTSASSF